MGGEKRMFQKVMPEILDTPKGIWGKIQRERKKNKKNSDTFQVLTGSKGQSSDKFTGSLGGTHPLNCYSPALSWVVKPLE